MMQVLTSPGASLSVSARIEERQRRGELTQRQVEDFRAFLADVDRDLLHHRVITDNRYTRWFQRGEATDEEPATAVSSPPISSSAPATG